MCPQPSGGDRELIPRLSTPARSDGAGQAYGAGARRPLNSKVPTAVSTLHVTTALPL
jgi:hypothetical protein